MNAATASVAVPGYVVKRAALGAVLRSLRKYDHTFPLTFILNCTFHSFTPAL